jgi:hypothetical protein
VSGLTAVDGWISSCMQSRPRSGGQPALAYNRSIQDFRSAYKRINWLVHRVPDSVGPLYLAETSIDEP